MDSCVQSLMLSILERRVPGCGNMLCEGHERRRPYLIFLGLPHALFRSNVPGSNSLEMLLCLVTCPCHDNLLLLFFAGPIVGAYQFIDGLPHMQ